MFKRFILAMVLSVSVVLLASMPQNTQAHSGRTSYDGGHYCWTNCSLYGVPYGVKHYHGGDTYEIPNTTETIIETVATETPIDTPKVRVHVKRNGKNLKAATVRIFQKGDFVRKKKTTKNGMIGVAFLEHKKWYRFKVTYKGQKRVFRKKIRTNTDRTYILRF